MQQTLRRLPGVRFETQAPPSPDVLPRMDVAGFVGFASAGPIDVPVPIEDATQFARIFGADAPLAWDADRGEQAYAHLGPAVRAFFRNGGRRCWVVRVADRADAATDLLPLPGLAEVHASGAIRPAALRARSPGSWADTLRVSASIEPTPLRLQVESAPAGPGAGGAFDVLVAAPGDVVVGDVVRVTFPDIPWTLVFSVASVSAGERILVEATPLARLDLTAALAYWIRTTTLEPGQRGHVHYLGAHELHVAAATATHPRAGDARQLVRVAVDASARTMPPPGTLLRATFGTRRIWIDVADVDASPDGSLAVVGTPFEIRRTRPPEVPPGAADVLAERLALQLRVETPDGSVVLGGLGLAAGHPRFVANLPSDEELFADRAAPPAPGTLGHDAAEPRFPLAGLEPESRPTLLLPLGVTILAGPALPPIRPPGTSRLRDGLGRFDTSLFLDERLVASSPATLREDAFAIAVAREDWRHLKSVGRAGAATEPPRLAGLHALLDVDEVTLVAVPDAVQRGWYLGPPARIREPDPPPPTEEPDWSRFLDCVTHVPAAPVLRQLGDEETGAFTLAWSATDAADAAYELREAVDPQFATARTLYGGHEREFSVYGRPRGSTLYYDVRALAGGSKSGWSNRIVVRTTQATRWFVDDAADYAAEDLIRAQLALLRFCAARGDVLAILALPEHYREPDAVAYVHTVRQEARGPSRLEPDPILSFGAVYHPWLFQSDPANPTAFRRTPPDGAATGVTARRAEERGAWVAAANEPLRDVVQLDPPIGPESYQAFQDAQINLVRHEPGGFLWLAADTLADDVDLRPIGVRRLLQLLRRMALLEGAAYAFEPNDDTFRRTLQRGFEGHLSRLFSLGAFAGSRPGDGFRVNAGSPPNVPSSVDAGRVVVELQVAPSRPLAFLSVRLVRTGAGELLVEAR